MQNSATVAKNSSLLLWVAFKEKQTKNRIKNKTLSQSTQPRILSLEDYLKVFR